MSGTKTEFACADEEKALIPARESKSGFLEVQFVA